MEHCERAVWVHHTSALCSWCDGVLWCELCDHSFCVQGVRSLSCQGFPLAAYEVAKMHVGLYLNFISADFMCLASFIESLEFQFGGLFGVGCAVQ